MNEIRDTADDPGQRRVLLLEDDEGVRRSLHLMLRGRGFDVRSYAAAAPLLRDPTIGGTHCLVADYRLSDSDGLKVRRALDERSWTGRSVLITAYPSAPLRDLALAAGYDAILEKPVRQHELIAALNEAG